MTKPIHEWARAVHVLAAEKGWWDKAKDPITGQLDVEKVKGLVAEKLNNIHDEISEGSGEARKDLWEIYWCVEISPNLVARLPRSQIKEIVDKAAEGDEQALKALSSLTSAVGMGPGAYEATHPEHRGAFFSDLIKIINGRFKPEGFAIELVDGIIRTLDLLEVLGYDVEEMMEMKHAYNKTRSYRHGNKRF